MENDQNIRHTEEDKKSDFTLFATKKVIVGILLAVVVFAAFSFILNFLGSSKNSDTIAHQNNESQHPASADPDHASQIERHETVTEHETARVEETSPSHTKDSHIRTEHSLSTVPPKSDVAGYTFVSATIAPLKYELERFWGWRTNDFVLWRITDNVAEFQLGVLEVTRRTTERLTEDLSRTGTTAAFVPELEKARSFFNNQATDFVFPSAESQFQLGLKSLEKYRDKLEKNQANFYTRTDNLLPLLEALEKLLGSCDDNLVKDHERNGKAVSFWQADNYFYYSQGVVHAVKTILSAVLVDFEAVLRSRNGRADLHHAIESCNHANDIQPWIIMNSDLDSIFANHRANLAAHISHARFYIGNVRKTLST